MLGSPRLLRMVKPTHTLNEQDQQDDTKDAEMTEAPKMTNFIPADKMVERLFHYSVVLIVY